jgi:molybdopterin-guanine dinucleotide biosynthesis protein A
MAGGRSTRYGEPKAFVPVGGRAIIERAADALRAVLPELIVSANDTARYAPLGYPVLPDRVPGLGALGGIHAALVYARETGRPGILAVACDMPFVSVPLLSRLVERAREAPMPDLVAPESDNRRGLEPLFAYYSTRCLPAIEHAMDRGDVRMIGFHDEVAVARLPVEEVRSFGDPAILFLNVNTQADREQADRVAREADA